MPTSEHSSTALPPEEFDPNPVESTPQEAVAEPPQAVLRPALSLLPASRRTPDVATSEITHPYDIARQQAALTIARYGRSGPRLVPEPIELNPEIEEWLQRTTAINRGPVRNGEKVVRALGMFLGLSALAIAAVKTIRKR